MSTGCATFFSYYCAALSRRWLLTAHLLLESFHFTSLLISHRMYQHQATSFPWPRECSHSNLCLSRELLLLSQFQYILITSILCSQRAPKLAYPGACWYHSNYVYPRRIHTSISVFSLGYATVLVLKLYLFLFWLTWITDAGNTNNTFVINPDNGLITVNSLPNFAVQVHYRHETCCHILIACRAS